MVGGADVFFDGDIAQFVFLGGDPCFDGFDHRGQMAREMGVVETKHPRGDGHRDVGLVLPNRPMDPRQPNHTGLRRQCSLEVVAHTRHRCADRRRALAIPLLAGVRRWDAGVARACVRGELH